MTLPTPTLSAVPTKPRHRRWRSLRATLLLLPALTLVPLGLAAAVPAPEALLPADTLAVFTVPDWSRAAGSTTNSALGQLWNDPSMKNFKDQFLKGWSADVVAPLEKELGLNFSDYTNLLQGQITFALTLNGWDGVSEKKPGWVLLLDAREQKEQLTKALADLRKKWVDAGRQVKSDKIRNVDTTTLIVRSDELSKLAERFFPEDEDKEDDADTTKKPAEPKKHDKFEVIIGISDSLLVVGNTAADLEKVLARQAGGGPPPLAEQAEFQSDQQAVLRDALGFGWVNFKPIYTIVNRQFTASAAAMAAQNPMAPKPEKILSSLGLSGLQSAALRLAVNGEGSFVDVFLRVPENGRQGIFKILLPEAKDSSPPSFVGSEAMKFTRWRLNGQKAWAGFESMLSSMSPAMAGVLQMGLGAVGKDKDPNFDLKASLIGNLGDDFITIQQAPKSTKPADQDPPSLYLIGSPNTERLVQGLKAATGLMPLLNASDAPLTEREFLGKKIYSLPLPSPPDADEKAPARSLNFAASSGYVALSPDAALIEGFLRSNEAAAKPLKDTPNLGESAQKVNGMATGYFGFENQSENMRAALESVKSNAVMLQKFLAEKGGKEAEGKDWFDLAQLPPFEKISKYFYFMVYSAQGNANGILWKVFAPTPPGLKK